MNNVTYVSPFCSSCKKTVKKENIFVKIDSKLCACTDEQLEDREFVAIHNFFCGGCAAPIEVVFTPIVERFCCPEEKEEIPNVVCQGELEEIDTWGDFLEDAVKAKRLNIPCDIKMNVPPEYLEMIYTDYRPDIIICWANGYHRACPDSRKYDYEDYSALQDPQYNEAPYVHDYGA